MSSEIDLSSIDQSPRLLFRIPLVPMQGQRFQPTGFPALGPATFQTKKGMNLLVESAQSMGNRLETVCWDEANQKPVAALTGISHVRVTRNKGSFFTDTMLEAHRLNSPYLLESKKDKTFFNELKAELGSLGEGPIDRRKLAKALLKFDAGSLIHGVFLAKRELAGGRLRVPRALSAFIEADGVQIAASGGVKNDHVNPQGITREGFGNVPFSRDEFTADNIVLYVNLDLALLRGYGLGETALRMLILLSLYKVAALVEGGLRLRTACDLTRADEGPIRADRPVGFALPSAESLGVALQAAIPRVEPAMVQTTFAFEDELKKGNETEGAGDVTEGGEE